MRTRKGGGTCSTHYCTWEDYYTVSHRVYEKYLKSKELSKDSPLADRKKHLPVSMDEIMEFLKIDCKENGGDRLCFGSKKFTHDWVARGHRNRLATSAFPYKRVSFEEIAKHAERSITSFLMGITLDELDKIRGKEVTTEKEVVREIDPQYMYHSQALNAGSKRKRKRTKRTKRR